MAEKDIRKYLYDVLIAIEEIEGFADGFTISHLEIIKNKWALERGIAIIGEALYKARLLNPALPVSDINKIIATRHIVVHDYDMIDNARLLMIVSKHLPILKAEVLGILKSEN
jgi:uncharacterized protein with HEPN domain